jgi:hypothetical protein
MCNCECYIFQSLHKILSPFPDDDVKALALKNQFNPSMLTRLIRSNFSTALLLPHITMDKLEQLQGIINETLSSATNFVLEQAEVKPNFDRVNFLFSCFDIGELRGNWAM